MRLRRTFSLVVTLSGVLVCPWALAEVAPSVPLACAPTQSTAQPALQPATQPTGSPSLPADLLATEPPIAASGCSVQRTCADGSTIRCSGNINCTADLCSISCDGNVTRCCDISHLECPERACAYCACLAEGFFTPAQCSQQVCLIHPR